MSPDLDAVNKVFSLQVGFFWTSIESEDMWHDYYFKDDAINYDTQNTMSLIYNKVQPIYSFLVYNS